MKKIKDSGKALMPLTVREILGKQIAEKLAQMLY